MQEKCVNPPFLETNYTCYVTYSAVMNIGDDLLI